MDEPFANEPSPGPVKVLHFMLGTAALGESTDARFTRTTIRQDMVDAATRLLTSKAGLRSPA